MRFAPCLWIDSLLCSQPTYASAPRAFSSFLCGSWWCILPLRKFTFHPFGSMACVATRAIAVSGVQFRTGHEYQTCQPHAGRFAEPWACGIGLESDADAREYWLDSATTPGLISEVRVSHGLHSNCTPLRGARGVPLFFQVSRYSPNQHLRSLNV